MKVLLINPNTDSVSLPHPPVGLAYLASVIEPRHDVYILDAHLLSLSLEKVSKRIFEICPDVVGLYANVGNVQTVKSVCANLKKNEFDGKIIVGGPSAVEYKNFLNYCDYVIVGEGEYTFKQLLEYLSRKNKKLLQVYKSAPAAYGKIGIALKAKNKKIKYIPKIPIFNLDKIPFPAWHLFPNLKKYKRYCRRDPNIPILTSRGCPYQCIYCNKNVFGFIFRPRTPKNVVKEIEWLIDTSGVREIEIVDDVFTHDIKRAKKICKLIEEKKIEILWKCHNGIRAETANIELLKLMKKAGCYFIGLGVESGNQEIINKIKRNQDLKVIHKAVKNIKTQNFILKAFFQIGLPYDTEKTMRETINLALKLNPDVAQFTITTPIPGTELYELVKKKGTFIANSSSACYYGGKAMYKIFDLDPKKVEMYWKLAYYEFYLRLGKIFSILSKVKSISEAQSLFKYTQHIGVKVFG